MTTKSRSNTWKTQLEGKALLGKGNSEKYVVEDSPKEDELTMEVGGSGNFPVKCKNFGKKFHKDQECRFNIGSGGGRSRQRFQGTFNHCGKTEHKKINDGQRREEKSASE